jgi:hypothetical protein
VTLTIGKRPDAAGDAPVTRDDGGHDVPVPDAVAEWADCHGGPNQEWY